jgi:V/A-type H+-transporting ATPase subunit I
MIIEMARIRIAGPREQAGAALRLLQDIGDLHLLAPAPGEAAAPAGRPTARPMRQARRVLDDVDAALAMLPAGPAAAAAPASVSAWPAAARRVRDWRRELAALARTQAALTEEQGLLLQYQTFFEAFEPLFRRAPRWPDTRASFVLLRPGAGASLDEIDRRLRAVAGARIELHSRPLPSGETAVLMLAAGSAAAQVESLLAGARLEDLPPPPGIDAHDLLHAMPALRSRLDEVRSALADAEARRREIAGRARGALLGLQAELHDLLLLAEAQAQVRTGELLFVLEGWMPAPAVAPLRARIARELGPEILVVQVATEPWTRADAPVALANPRLFRPFELITRAFPLPRYGSIDPTPFVAVFFPMFFGLMLGDVGYGLVLALVAGVVRRRARPGSRAMAVAEMALACALFAIVFGVLFGEFFGTLGAELGMRALVVDREHALAPFLVFTIALGAVHVVLGLVLGLVGAWRQGERRKALGRGLTIVMIGLTALALLAAFEVLPSRLFTPVVIAVLVAFPILVALEGIIAVVDLMSAFGHILSYARIMALGTASLMLAMVANRMVGALGSALVGVAFALLFHLVNFAIGLFSPTIHALRLHYVEFFGEFYSPGGTAYRPFGHWHRAAAA